ncbi:hypothetical protein C8R44DRAFT_877251 [Mycena epipterygia]|nr:hypothetical protein C8R44DRAFT_877251 [Mycena epipterygia]
MSEQHFLNGRQFMTTTLRNYVVRRVFQTPVGSYDAIQDAIFSHKTFIWLFEHAGIEVSPASTVYRAFLLFIGAILEELGETALIEWFAATFRSLVVAAEETFVNKHSAPRSCVEDVLRCYQESLPAFFSEGLFGPPLVPPPGPFFAHADLALRMLSQIDSSSFPSAAVFAPGSASFLLVFPFFKTATPC